MEPTDYTMEDFLKEAKDTLKQVNKATNLFKWLFGGLLTVMLVMVMDTRIEVVKKADACDVMLINDYLKDGIYREFLTKKDGLTAIKLQDDYHKELIIRYSSGDSLLESSNYEWVRNSIFDQNYRGTE